MIGLILATVLVLLLAWKFAPWKQTAKKIPGLPRKDKVLGNLADIAKAGNMQAFLKQLHQHHGPLASFWYGDVFTVSLADTKYFKITEKMFDRHPALFKFAEPLISPKSMQFLNGTFGRERYKLLSEPFSFKGCAELFPRVCEIVQEEIKSWKDGDRIPLHETMMKLAINNITQTHFGCNLRDKTNSELLNQYYSSVIDSLDDVLNGVWSFGSGDSRERIYEENLKIFKDFMRKIVDEHRESRKSGDYNVAPFLDMLIDNIDDEDELVHQAITFIIGGFHTTGNYLTWFFYNLACRKQLQESVSDEVKVVFNAGFKDINDISKLSLTKRVMNETLRNEKIATFSERQADKDIEVDGFVIPKGSQIVNALTETQDNKNTFPDPDNFNLENMKENKKLGLEFSPFGFGIRKCPGYRFSDMEVAIAGVEILSQFKLNLKDEDSNIGSTFGFVTKPEREIFVTVQKQ